MNKEFKIDEKKKKQVHKKYLHRHKGWMYTSYGILIFMIIVDIVFGIYGLVLKDTFIIWDITDSRYGTKNVFLVWYAMGTVDIVILFLWYIHHMVAVGWTGRFISQRVNESLTFMDSKIEYGYQNSVNSDPNDRVVIMILKDTIEKIVIDEKVSKIEIKAQICQVYYDNYKKRKTRADVNDFESSTFTTFDYYVPELIPYLKEEYKEKLEKKNV